MTVRDLKDRLNHAIMIMSSRQEYRSTSAVTFEACAAVTYLESQYPKDYGHLIQNEQKFLLINLNLLSPNNFDYISDLICSKKLPGNVLAKAKEIMISYLDLISGGMESIILKFLDINCLVDDRLFHSICTKSDSDHLVSYINNLVVDEITDQYYTDIDTRGIENGLSENILNGLAEKGFYKCILLHAANDEDYQLLDQKCDNVDCLCESCTQLFEDYPDTFLKIRYHLCLKLKNHDCLMSLFNENYPLISEQEYVSFQSIGGQLFFKFTSEKILLDLLSKV